MTSIAGFFSGDRERLNALSGRVVCICRWKLYFVERKRILVAAAVVGEIA